MRVALVLPAYRVDSFMAGIGVRAWELAQALAPRFPVTILCRAASDLASDGVRLVPASAWREVVDECSAAVFYDLPDTRILLACHRAGKLVLSDNAVQIEHLQYHGVRCAADPEAVYRDLMARFRLQLLLSDHFIVRSEVARSTLIASLGVIGRLNVRHHELSSRLDHLLSFLPIGFNRKSESHARAQPRTMTPTDFAWTGGIWDFYEPGAAVRAVAALVRAGTPASLRFLYMPPPDQVLEEGRALLETIAELGVGEWVELCRSPIPHAARDGVVKSSGAAICLAKQGIENWTSVRLRLRDSLLYRLPLVVDRHGATGDLVRALGIGLAVDPEDTGEVAAAMASLTRDSPEYRRLVANIERVREDFRLETHLSGLLRFLERGESAPDHAAEDQKRRVASLLSEHPEVEESPRYPF